MEHRLSSLDQHLVRRCASLTISSAPKFSLPLGRWLVLSGEISLSCAMECAEVSAVGVHCELVCVGRS